MRIRNCIWLCNLSTYRSPNRHAPVFMKNEQTSASFPYPGGAKGLCHGWGGP